MASNNQGKAKFISHKLNFLKDQRDCFISVVNEIIASGESWIQRGSNNLEYQELSQMIDTTSEFLCDICAELTGGSVGVAAHQLSNEQPGQTSQSIATASSPQTISSIQPSARLASTATTSDRQSTEFVQPADGAQVKSILDRIAVIEEVMCSSRSRTETVAEHHSGIDQQLKELLSKLSESDKKHSSRFKQIKQQISDISETQDAREQEQKTRLQSLEKKLQKISTAQNRLKAEMESQAELVEKLVHVPNLLESMKENVDVLDDRIDRITDYRRNKHQDIETVTRDLEDKVMANTQSAQLISEGQAQNTTLLGELETRLQTLEADGGRNVKGVQKQAGKGETNLRILCQMLNDRLRPLEQLRTCLNERLSKRDDNVTKLSQLIREVAVMSPRLQQLEVKSSRTRCAFTAFTSLTGQIAPYTISQYETTNVNVGGNFNADSGIFTAPVDGLYVASLSFILWEDEDLEDSFTYKQCLEVGVEYKQSQDQESCTHVCFSSAATTNNTTACDVAVVDMKAGEVLHLRVYEKETNDFGCEVTFSCFLLG